MAGLSDQSWRRQTICKSPAPRRRRPMKHATCSKSLNHSSFQYTTQYTTQRRISQAKTRLPIRTQNKTTSSIISHVNVSIIWNVVLLICTGVCLWQCAERIMYYLDEPVTYAVNIVRLNEVHFPVITFCPTTEPFDNNTWEDKYTFWPYGDFSLKEAWEEHRLIVNETILIAASCNEDNSACNFDVGLQSNLTILETLNFYGSCLTILPGQPTYYRSAATFMYFTILPGNHNAHLYGQETAAQESEAAYRHESYFLPEWMQLNEEVLVRLSLKQFNFLNTSKNRCDDEATVTECRNRCADIALDENVNCSLPFMVSKKPACETLEEALEAQEQSMNFYEEFTYSHCHCRRQCVEKVYSYNYNTAGKETVNKTTLTVRFSENMVQNVTELFAYSFSALISDVGGGLGFFLGLSVLSVFKELENALASYFVKNDNKRAAMDAFA